MPPDVAAALQGTLWASNAGRQRMVWNGGSGSSEEGHFPIGPNTDIIIGVEDGRYLTRQHPLFPNGSPAWQALVERGRAAGWSAQAPRGGGRISDTFTGDPNFQGMTPSQIREQFGHLAGRSPFEAAMPQLNPFAWSPDDGTPASLLGNIFGAIPGPGTSLVGPIARFGQQAAINDATPPTFEGFENAWQGSFAPGMATGSAVEAGDPSLGYMHEGGPVTKGAPAGPERRAMLLEGEFVVRPEAAKKHRPLLEAINSGASTKKLRSLLDG
ncbi:MAG TPA: hypothetical protein VEA38_22080 [Terriglobales bacterium]|nr:hypothetical protein [Terriglobales bacterium]